MKVLFVDPMSYSNLGIYDKYLLENINCEKIFFASKNLQFSNIKNTNIIFNYIYQSKKGIQKVLSYCYSQARVLSWAHNNNPQIIHFQWLKIPFFDIFLLLSIKFLCRKSRLVYTAHNILPHDTGMKYLFLYFIIYHLFEGIIVHEERSKYKIEKLFNIHNDKIIVIPHGLLSLNRNKKNIRRKNDKMVFSLIGKLGKYKGVDILIDAWTNNDKLLNNNSIKLIIAGEGEFYINEKHANKNILEFNYRLADDEIQKIIEETDVGILPYRKISQSGVLLSLLAAHKPVLVSNCGGLVQPFEVGTVGWIIKKLESMSLAEQILDIVSHRELVGKIKKDKLLWAKIDDYYSWKRIGKMTYEYYHMIIKCS